MTEQERVERELAARAQELREKRRLATDIEDEITALRGALSTARREEHVAERVMAETMRAHGLESCDVIGMEIWLYDGRIGSIVDRAS